MFTQRHYKFIAEVLLSVGNYPTKDLIVDYFIKSLELDNPNFKPDLFRKASDVRLIRPTEMYPICDSCFMVAEDVGVPPGEEERVMMSLGGEVADHLCDQIESNGDIKCACSCHMRKER